MVCSERVKIEQRMRVGRVATNSKRVSKANNQGRRDSERKWGNFSPSEQKMVYDLISSQKVKSQSQNRTPRLEQIAGISASTDITSICITTVSASQQSVLFCCESSREMCIER